MLPRPGFSRTRFESGRDLKPDELTRGRVAKKQTGQLLLPSPQQGDLKLSALCQARVPVAGFEPATDLRANLLATVPPTPRRIEGERCRIGEETNKLHQPEA
ncbi:hypothetical protein PoB_004586900 [Plakobranchus ocellatus]|uniref:Uncharacterized protein n=1 Tax=Plakobranchus ocellatus TaxID=259542 RepID=A0AAV4BM16_9GAST|nr:hypothetical protein PoB_004586900 [Plakobranchus ocellatus]